MLLQKYLYISLFPFAPFVWVFLFFYSGGKIFRQGHGYLQRMTMEKEIFVKIEPQYNKLKENAGRNQSMTMKNQ